MAFNTKIRIDDNHVEQLSGETLTLSGNTIIGISGDMKYASHPNFTDDTQLIDKKYVDDNVISGSTSATTYNLLSPAALTVGGITVGTVLTGKSTNCIIQDMLFPELCGTLTAPSTLSTTLSCTANCLEVGAEIASMNVTSVFSRGSINPQYCSASAFRSGEAISYCFTGAQTNASYVCTANSAVRPISNYEIQAGANTWGSCTTYGCGVQPVSNKGINFDSPLPSGTTTAKSDTITGIYPFFFGVSGTVPTPNSALISGGSKCVATSSSDISIQFGVQTNKYLWFATPAASTTKQGWWEGPILGTNKGNIGTLSDLFNAPSTVSVDSPDACWSGQSYKIYVGNYPTDTSNNVYCMTNAAQQ